MDRTLLSRRLTQAEKHCTEAEENLRRQRELIAALERDGRDTSEARSRLAQFEQAQTQHIASRDRMARELATEERRDPVDDPTVEEPPASGLGGIPRHSSNV